jgi:aryl-alcohol dehydrogenase-like predicted oxidoreductase
MGFIAYSPLGRGFLAGLFRDLKQIPEDDERRRSPRFQEGNFEYNLELLDRIEPLAKEKSATLAQLALAWLMAQGTDIIPIPGAKSRNHLEENIKAINIELTEEDLSRLNIIMPPDAAAGNRLAEAQMTRVNI